MYLITFVEVTESNKFNLKKIYVIISAFFDKLIDVLQLFNYISK